MTNIMEAALEYLDRGWVSVPINPKTKVCPFGWGQISESKTLPTHEEVEKWFEPYLNYDIAILTGRLSNLVVVDCDNMEAVDKAKELGLTRTPVVVETKKGFHFYYSHPTGDAWIKSFVGANNSGVEWAKCSGLDLRGSKGMVFAPPSVGKSWQLMPGADFDDLPMFQMPTIVQPKVESKVINLEDFRLEHVSFVGVKPEGYGVWERTKEDVDELGRKIDAGDGCHSRIVSLVGELVAIGMTNHDVYKKCREFCDTFMLNPFDDDKIINTIDDITKSDKRNHPERDVAKDDIIKKEESKEPDTRLITVADIERLEGELGSVQYFVEPFIPTTGTIIQFHGYSGHGKSTFARHLLYSTSAGQDAFGCFMLHRRPRVLYLDFENSRANVVNFLKQARATYGDAGDHFKMWCPFDNRSMMNLKSEAGLNAFKYLVKASKPNIVVIDTIRSAFPSMIENSSDDWSYVNAICLALRNEGISVILLHHSNKPSDNGQSGREAGSTNQLTVLETQIKITQIFEDETTANVKAGIHDPDVFLNLRTPPAIKTGEVLDLMYEIRYGKVREPTNVHEPFHQIGMAYDPIMSTFRPVAYKSAKQRAVMYAREWEDKSGAKRPALSNEEIASRIKKPLYMVKEWTEEIRTTDHASHLAELKSNR